jgi:hypothetical protein
LGEQKYSFFINEYGLLLITVKIYNTCAMETGLLHLHNILRWVILLGLLASIATVYNARSNQGKPLWLVTLIAAHITLVIGLYQWYNMWQRAKDSGMDGMGNIMKNKAWRFWLVEHPITMIIGIILVTLAYNNTKASKYRTAFWFFLFAFVLMMSGVPWPFRTEIARPLFPGMQQ